jgi:monoamine oxidase
LTILRNRFWLADRKAPTASSDELGQCWEATDNQMSVVEAEARVLAVFAGGRYARLSPAEIERGLQQVYTGYSAARIAARLFDWTQEPWTWCGYSCPAPGQVTSILKELNTDFKQTRLVYGGEHTSSAFGGYMEGALESGSRLVELLRS